MRLTTTISVLALTVAAAAANAATLDLVRQRLAQLPGTTAIAGRIEVVMDETTKKARESRRAGAEFEVDRTALRVTIPAGDFSEDAQTTPRNGPPHQNASLIKTTDVWGRVNCAPGLLKRLRRATLISDQSSAWKGQPARRLELKIEPEAMTDAPKFLKMKSDETFVIWVAADGTPIASEQQEKISVRLLLISASGAAKQVAEYVVTGDRLIVAHDAQESNSSGMGEEGQEKTTTTVTLRR